MSRLEKINILPINDIHPHREDEYCMCNPTIKEYNNVLIVTHNSFDGREFNELSPKPIVG